MVRFLLIAIFVFTLNTGVVSADQNDPRLNKLFTQLQATDKPLEAKRLVSAIWSIWLLGENDRVSQKLAIGVALFQQSRFEEALDIFDEIIENYPDYSEAWNKRATLYFVVGRMEESLFDVEKTISLEPRHFGALSGAGRIYMEQERWDKALQAYRQAMRVNPHIYGGEEIISQLEDKLKGI